MEILVLGSGNPVNWLFNNESITSNFNIADMPEVFVLVPGDTLIFQVDSNTHGIAFFDPSLGQNGTAQ